MKFDMVFDMMICSILVMGGKFPCQKIRKNNKI